MAQAQVTRSTHALTTFNLLNPAMNNGIARVAALLAMVGWSLIAPQPAQAQLGTGSLIITVTSPASGSTVSGTVPVTASVTSVGALTVAGVQFKLDGNNLGAEDTTAPYSVSWDTTTTSNASHTLTAVARDSLGMLWTSDPVTVTVFNDTTQTSVTIDQAAGQADPTSASPINFTAVFSKPVSGFTGAGVTLSGTAGGTKTVTVSGGPSTYNVAVSGMTSSGTVLASIPAGVAQDAAGKPPPPALTTASPLPLCHRWCSRTSSRVRATGRCSPSANLRTTSASRSRVTPRPPA